MSARGRWFTDSLDEAVQRALAQGGRVLWLDVPEALASRWAYYDAPECGTPDEPSSYVVSVVVRATARVWRGDEAPAGIGKLRLYRGTGPDEPEDGR